MTKTQIDRLGARLRAGPVTEADLRLLDSYRLSFSAAYEHVVASVRHQLGVEPTGRPNKSTVSIIEKLRRESIRLSQIQDIAGCRVIVDDTIVQAKLASDLPRMFPKSTIIDRRANPSHGYRAVHVIVRSGDKAVEIQIRTALQHLWAELSEKLADLLDPGIKYGSGPPETLESLLLVSDTIAEQESLEEVIAEARYPEGMETNEAKKRVVDLRHHMIEGLQNLISMMSKARSV